MSELTCSTANYFSLGNILTHFCDFHFILPNVFLSSPFYLKSEAESYEQQVLICVDILFVDWVDIGIHEMKFLFVLTLHSGKPAGRSVTSF